MEKSDLMNETEAAAFIGLSKKTLQTWRSKRMGPAYIRISPKCIRYKCGDLLAYMEKRRVELS